jgi:hypothetical protein
MTLAFALVFCWVSQCTSPDFGPTGMPRPGSDWLACASAGRMGGKWGGHGRSSEF